MAIRRSSRVRAHRRKGTNGVKEHYRGYEIVLNADNKQSYGYNLKREGKFVEAIVGFRNKEEALKNAKWAVDKR